MSAHASGPVINDLIIQTQFKTTLQKMIGYKASLYGSISSP